MHSLRRLLLPMVALGILAQRGSAQAAPVRLLSQTYIGVNPIGVVGNIGTVELETGVVQGITVGGVASYIDVDHDRFTTFEFKARYYPAEVVLRDWSIGATLGGTHFSTLQDTTIGQVNTHVRQSMTAPTLGLIVDKNWLTGRGEHFLIGTGVGAKRVLASRDDRDRVDIGPAIFTARLILGYAF